MALKHDIAASEIDNKNKMGDALFKTELCRNFQDSGPPPGPIDVKTLSLIG